MKYFAKYLPVEGKLTDGDKGMSLREGLLTYYDHIESYCGYDKDFKKVKLFLCSNDIQVGDTFIIPEDTVVDWDLRVSNEGVCTSISMEGKMFHYKAPCSIGGTVHSGVHIDHNPFKVIGEISPDLLDSIKEGDEFNDMSVILTSD